MAASLGRSVVPIYDDYTAVRDQTTMVAAPTFVPFKFEPRRARLDWRMLHGVDINMIVSNGWGLALPWVCMLPHRAYHNSKNTSQRFLKLGGILYNWASFSLDVPCGS